MKPLHYHKIMKHHKTITLFQHYYFYYQYEE